MYELNDNFKVLPTYIVAPGFVANALLDWPGIEFDLPRVLHGEQYIEMYRPLPSEGRLRSEARIVDILDKGSGALMLCDSRENIE